MLCGGAVPTVVAEANATFRVVYELETGSSGAVVNVTRLRNALFPDNQLMACLGDWVLPAPNTKSNVLLEWTHAAGWTRMVVVMPGFPAKTITIDPGWQ